MRKFALFVIFFVLCFKFLVSCVLAKDFSSFYKTTYEFLPSGEASVSQEISIVNLSPDLYVSEYTLSTVGGEISKIEAFDKIGPLKIESQIKEKSTIITLIFNERVVGKEKVLSFILKYKVNGLAKKEGNIWQINIPRLSNLHPVDDYQLILKIPLVFGKIAFVNPSPKNEENKDNFYFLNFSGKDLSRYGVNVTLGQYQTFNFNLNYDLNNTSSNNRIEKIAIPPDTNYQTVYYHKIDPKPLNIEIDEDGNWLASFDLYPKQKISVNVQGWVNIFSRSKQKLSFKNSSLDKYLEVRKYWPVQDPKISQLSSDLKTVENIYRFVIGHLKYDFGSIKTNAIRKGAAGALENPENSICSDFTDLFIALSRAAKIPAREIEGFAFSDNPVLKEISSSNDLLHSWPEYFDIQKQEWIMVDPTWESTSGGLDFFNKFDMSHFVFVIHGLSDIFPLSPGSYKDEDSLVKQILVSFSSEEDKPQPKHITISKVIPDKVFSLGPRLLEVEFKNESGFSLSSEELLVKSEEKLSASFFKFPLILPYSFFRIKISFHPKEIFKDYRSVLVFEIAGNQLTHSVSVRSLGLRIILFSGVFLSAIIMLILFSLKKSKNEKIC